MVPRIKETTDMKFYGQFQPPVDQVLFERYLANWCGEPGYFVESGAFDGVTESNCMFLEESLGWRGVNVEPFPQHYQKLLVNRPQSINVNCALSAQNGSQTFTHVAHPRHGDNFGNGSLSHTDEHQRFLCEQGCQFRTLQVPTMTYDTLVTMVGLPRVDLLSLDVEGHELQVLEGMNREQFLPRIICVETGHDRQQAIDERLRAKGYVKDYEYRVNGFYVRAA
jgi:FkbM family methyltransferase